MNEKTIKLAVRIGSGFIIMVAGGTFFYDGFFLNEPKNFYEVLIAFQIFLFGVALALDKVELEKFTKLPLIG